MKKTYVKLRVILHRGFFSDRMEALLLSMINNEYFCVPKIYCALKILIQEVTENLSSFAKLSFIVKHIVNFNEN